jgi:hypothetical protein
MKRLIVAAALVAGVLCGSSSVQATSLAPGKTVKPKTATLADGSIVDSGSTTITVGGDTTTLLYAAYKESVSGMIDYLYQIVNSSKSTDSVLAFSNTDFTGLNTSVYNVSPKDSNLSGSIFDTSGSVKATKASRPTKANGGRTVGFFFLKGDGIDPGSSSVILEIQTNSTSVKQGTTSILGVGTVTTFAATPEPASVMLLGGCFVGLGGAFGWRRWRAKARPASAA